MADRSQLCFTVSPDTLAMVERMAAQWKAPLGRTVSRLIEGGLANLDDCRPSPLVQEVADQLAAGVPAEPLIMTIRTRHRLNRRQTECLIAEARALEAAAVG
jgi:hypothetical protein